MARNLSCVYLAAGASERFGESNKLLSSFQGKPLFLHGLNAFLEAGLDKIFLVTGPEPEPFVTEIKQHVKDPDPIQTVRNPDPDRGQVSSVVSGFDAVEANGKTNGTFVSPADMPFLNKQVVRRLAEAFDPSEKPIVVPQSNGSWRMPRIIPVDLFSAFRALTPGTPGKTVVNEHRSRVVSVSFENKQLLEDIDTQEEITFYETKHE